MLGDGIVSFGTAVVTVSRRNAKSSPKIVCSSRTGSSTRIEAGVKTDAAAAVLELDREVGGELLDAAELVDEVHVPGAAAQLAVGRRLQADGLLHAHALADGVVLDPAQLVRVDRPGGVIGTRLQKRGGRSRLPT